jgi:hypothetical protein
MRSICKKGSVTLVAVLALCALAAASASAAELYVGGKALSGTSAFAQTPKVEGSITISDPTDNFKIKCTGVDFENAKTSELSAPGSAGFGSVVYQGCEFVERPSCTIEGKEILEPKLEATFAKGTGTEDTMTIRFGTKSGETKFGSFYVDGESKCGGLAYNNVLQFNESKPSLVLTMPTGQSETAEQAVVFPGEKESIEYYGSKAYVSGSFKLKLTSGAKWSFH